MTDEERLGLEKFNKFYPNAMYCQIGPLPSTGFDGQEEVNGKMLSTKRPLNYAWTSNPWNYKQAIEWIEQGGRIGWVVPEGMCVIDVDEKEPGACETIKHIIDEFECKYSMNKSCHGTHFVFMNKDENIKTVSGNKCGINFTIDARANGTGMIILPINDPNREWGIWHEYVEEVPYFLKPLLREDLDNKTPSFLGLVEGDSRNDSLYRWRMKLGQTQKLTTKEIENTIRTINEYILGEPIGNDELFQTVLRKGNAEKDNPTIPKAKGKNKHNAIAASILEQMDLAYFAGIFYKFKENYYKELENGELEVLIHKYDENLGGHDRNEILKFLALKTQCSIKDFNKVWYKIACKNGIVNLLTGELERPNKTEMNTIQIPWNYNVKAEFSPRVDAFIRRLCYFKKPGPDGKPVTDTTKMTFLYEIPGYSMLKKNVFQKFFIFQGEGGTGKSKYQELMRQLLGESNCAAVSLANFDKDYYISKLPGKLLNLDDDAVDGKTLEDTGRFKSIISGGKVSTREIRKEVIEFEPFVTCVFNCNLLPRIMDNTSGLYRRLVLVDMSNKIDNPDPMIVEKMCNDVDMEYFFLKCVEAIRDAIKRAKLSINDSDKELLRKFKCRQSPLNEWIYESNMTTEDIWEQPCLSLYNRFKIWCEQNGYTKPPAIFTFKENMMTLFNVETINLQGKVSGFAFGRRTGMTDADKGYKPFGGN